MKFDIAATTLLISTIMMGTPTVAAGTRNLGKSKSMSEDDCECDGVTYYKYISFASSGFASWTRAYESTPAGCVLAPVTSQADLDEIASVIPDLDPQNAWLGIYKSAEQVALDSVGAPPYDRSNWLNLDGSTVPTFVTQGVNGWFGAEPNNFADLAPETRVFYRNGFGLNDGGARFIADGAVYKCCAEQVSFCVVDPDLVDTMDL